MGGGKTSETVTENLFRDFYGANTFIEKSSIPDKYGFVSKQGTANKGYPDFFLDNGNYVIIVEAKAESIRNAEEEVKLYIENNKITKHIVGIAIAGQTNNSLKVTYFFKSTLSEKVEKFNFCNCFKTIDDISLEVHKKVYGDDITDKDLTKLLSSLNQFFHDYKIRDSDRSLFFSALLIALTDANFRNIYKNIQPPSHKSNTYSLECENLNTNILTAVSEKLKDKVNSHSKKFEWLARFAFIKNIDIPLDEYINAIDRIEKNVYSLVEKKEKQDLLGKAYKIFLSRSGAAENKNIILTPDHIKSLMVRLGRVDSQSVILDTCTGSGAFLMEAMERMVEDAQGNDKVIEDIHTNRLIGFEIDPILFSLACSNMFLHGDGRTNLIFGNSLLRENVPEELKIFNYIKSLKPTHVIINPPYEKNEPILFTKKALDFLDKNGQLIIIMPSVTLYKSQNRQKIEEILKTAKLNFIIKLPKSVFKEQKRDVYPSIFGFTKGAHNPNDEVIFCDIYDDCLVSVQHKGRIDKNELWYDKDGKNNLEAEIFNIITNHKSQQIVINGKNVGNSYSKKIFHNGELKLFYGINDNESSSFVKMSDLFNMKEKGSLQSEDNDQSGEFDFITCAEQWKKHSTFDHNEEAIVYAIESEGSLGRASYVNGKFIASTLTIIMTVKDAKKYPIDLEFYSYYLMSIRDKIVRDLAYGTSKLTIKQADLSEYRIEYYPLGEQIKLKEKIKQKKEKIKEVELELNKLNASLYTF